MRDAIIGTGVAIDKMLALTSQTPVGIQSRIARSSEAAKRHDLALDRLPNTWQIDCHFVRFDAARCEFDKLPIFIGKSRFQRVATPLGFEPRITPPKGAVLPLHHGVLRFAILDRRFSMGAQRSKLGGNRFDEQLAAKITVE